MIYITAFILLSTTNLVTSEVNATNIYLKFIRNFYSKIGVTTPVGYCRVDQAVVYTIYNLGFYSWVHSHTTTALHLWLSIDRCT